MNRKLMALICMFLIVLTPFTAADIEEVEEAVDDIPGLENTQLDPGFDELVPTIDGEFNEDNEYDVGESIVLNVVDYEPKVLTSNLIEDNNVPVYAFLSATSFGNFVQDVGEIFGEDLGVSDLEPLYGGFQIENVRIRPADVGTQDIIAGQPKYIKPGKFTSDNAGYIYMTLKQIEAEADIPDNINMTFNAEVWFSEVTRLYSLAQTSLVLPIDPDYDEWSDSLDSE